MNQNLLKKIQKRILIGNSVETITKVFSRSIESKFGDKYQIEIVTEETDSEILRLAQLNVFDVFILILNNIMVASRNLPAEERVQRNALQLVTYLMKRYKKPVIALYGWPDDSSYPEKVISAGARFVFKLPVDIKEFQKAVEKCLDIH